MASKRPRKQTKRPAHRPRAAPINRFGLWLEESGLTVVEVAQAIGASTQGVYNLLRENTKPSRDRAVAIERLSKGAVPVSSW